MLQIPIVNCEKQRFQQIIYMTYRSEWFVASRLVETGRAILRSPNQVALWTVRLPL